MENESSTNGAQTNGDEGEFKEGHDGNNRTVHPFTASQNWASCLEPLDSREANFGAIGWLPCQPGYSLGTLPQHATLVTSLSSDAKASSIQCASREEDSGWRRQGLGPRHCGCPEHQEERTDSKHIDEEGRSL